jgi:hypothetical protein
MLTRSSATFTGPILAKEGQGDDTTAASAALEDPSPSLKRRKSGKQFTATHTVIFEPYSMKLRGIDLEYNMPVLVDIEGSKVWWQGHKRLNLYNRLICCWVCVWGALGRSKSWSYVRGETLRFSGGSPWPPGPPNPQTEGFPSRRSRSHESCFSCRISGGGRQVVS